MPNNIDNSDGNSRSVRSTEIKNCPVNNSAEKNVISQKNLVLKSHISDQIVAKDGHEINSLTCKTEAESSIMLAECEELDSPLTPKASSSCCSCCHSAGKSYGCEDDETFQNVSDGDTDQMDFTDFTAQPLMRNKSHRCHQVWCSEGELWNQNKPIDSWATGGECSAIINARCLDDVSNSYTRANGNDKYAGTMKCSFSDNIKELISQNRSSTTVPERIEHANALSTQRGTNSGAEYLYVDDGSADGASQCSTVTLSDIKTNVKDCDVIKSDLQNTGADKLPPTRAVKPGENSDADSLLTHIDEMSVSEGGHDSAQSNFLSPPLPQRNYGVLEMLDDSVLNSSHRSCKRDKSCDSVGSRVASGVNMTSEFISPGLNVNSEYKSNRMSCDSATNNETSLSNQSIKRDNYEVDCELGNSASESATNGSIAPLRYCRKAISKDAMLSKGLVVPAKSCPASHFIGDQVERNSSAMDCVGSGLLSACNTVRDSTEVSSKTLTPRNSIEQSCSEQPVSNNKSKIVRKDSGRNKEMANISCIDNGIVNNVNNIKSPNTKNGPSKILDRTNSKDQINQENGIAKANDNRRSQDTRTVDALSLNEVQKDNGKKRSSLRGLFRRKVGKQKKSSESPDCSESPDGKGARHYRGALLRRQRSIDDITASNRNTDNRALDIRRNITRNSEHSSQYTDSKRTGRCVDASNGAVSPRPRSLLARLSQTLRNPFMRRDRSVSAIRYTADVSPTRPATLKTAERVVPLLSNESRRSRAPIEVPPDLATTPSNISNGSGRVGRRAECLGRGQVRGRAVSPDTRPIVSSDGCSRIHFSASRCAGDGSGTRSHEDIERGREDRRERETDEDSHTETEGDVEDNVTSSDRPETEFMKSLVQLKECGWYWGPLDWEEAEALLENQMDGSFLVRDSSNEHYILSLTFRSQGSIHHTRIEHYKGMFSFHSQPKSHGAATIVEFIKRAMDHSRSGRYLYFLRPRGAGHPPAPVQLLHPVSRFTHVQSLQHRCRFVILQHVRRDHIAQLPLPGCLQDYLVQAQYYTERDIAVAKPE